MKIAYVVNTYPRPSHSFIRREILALERRGVEVLRIAMRGDRAALVDPGDIAEHDRTEHVLRLGPLALLRAVLAALADPGRAAAALRLAWRCGGAARARLVHLVYLAEAAHVRRRCRDEGVAHVHAHFGTNSATVAMLCHALGGPPWSFTTHGPEEFDAPRALSLGLKVEASRFAVAISAFGRSQLCRWAKATAWPRIVVVPCGIEPAAFADPPPLPPRDGPLRLVAVGRLSEQKGQLLLVEALARALRDGADLHLTLVGDGELRAPIEAAIARAGIADRVTLTGWVDEARVRAELAAAQVMVMPSFAEGLPMVIMEAMAARRPVIATWVAGIPELVRDGDTGRLVPAGDAPALAAAMAEMAALPADRLAEMGARGRDRALARHDIDRSAALLHRLFQDGPPDEDPQG